MLEEPKVHCVYMQRLEGALEAAIGTMTGLARDIIMENMSGLEYTHRELGNSEFYSTWEIETHIRDEEASNMGLSLVGHRFDISVRVS